jgi:predicted DCC family thiol-disulfide oxidoreductase YuxK
VYIYYEMIQKNTILFDSRCNLCSKTVKNIMKIDSKSIFNFISNNSKSGKKIITDYNLNSITTQTIILFTSEKEFLIKSDAVIAIISRLNFVFKIFNVFSVIPKKIRDIGYDYIARNRYNWFGENDNCEITNDIY